MEASVPTVTSSADFIPAQLDGPIEAAPTLTVDAIDAAALSLHAAPDWPNLQMLREGYASTPVGWRDITSVALPHAPAVLSEAELREDRGNLDGIMRIRGGQATQGELSREPCPCTACMSGHYDTMIARYPRPVGYRDDCTCERCVLWRRRAYDGLLTLMRGEQLPQIETMIHGARSVDEARIVLGLDDLPPMSYERLRAPAGAARAPGTQGPDCRGLVPEQVGGLDAEWNGAMVSGMAHRARSRVVVRPRAPLLEP
jgi:hypothetical protein